MLYVITKPDGLDSDARNPLKAQVDRFPFLVAGHPAEEGRLTVAPIDASTNNHADLIDETGLEHGPVYIPASNEGEPLHTELR